MQHRKTQEKVLRAILEDGSPKKATKIVRDVIQDIKNGDLDLEDLVINTQITRNPESYQQKAPHVMAAKKAMERGRKVVRGSIMRYVVVKG